MSVTDKFYINLLRRVSKGDLLLISTKF